MFMKKVLFQILVRTRKILDWKPGKLRIFFALLTAGVFVSAVEEAFPVTHYTVDILIGTLVFIIINTALRFVSIDDLLTRINLQ